MQQSLFNLLDDAGPGEYEIPAGKPGQCRSCKQAIIWTKTATGKPIPLDLATARSLPDGRRMATTHFATCPEGREWRRK